MFIVLVLIVCSHGYVALHNPRGSGNRLTEPLSHCQNPNRLFDSFASQSLGYPAGPNMYYYSGSKLRIMWDTSQSAMGSANIDVDTDTIIQYMCGESVRDGDTTTVNRSPNTPPYCGPTPTPGSGCDPSTYTNPIYGVHEDYTYYSKCYTRSRNGGLFTATMNLNNNRGATATRQNVNGNYLRFMPSSGPGNHGFECPEERGKHHTCCCLFVCFFNF
jgi:hypothetical protein